MTQQADIVVIGAGTAGAAAAAALAQTGRGVLVLESGPLDKAGARWMNGLPVGEVEAAGLALPEPQRPAPFHLIAGWGPERVTVQEPPIVDVDMRWLVRALQDRATESGAVLRGDQRVVDVTSQSDGARVTLRDGAPLHAALVVDAAGLTGPTRRSPCPPHRLCAAAQAVHIIDDVGAARAWLDENDLRPGETASFAGLAGGYSILNVHVTLEPEPTVSLLTGSIPALGHPPGVAILQRFVESAPWIGMQRFGGARAIPLTAPEPIVGQGCIARLGDAARQVFAGHGSGIAQGLRAARLLAETIAEGGGPWEYNVRFQRGEAATLAASAAVAAWTAHLSLEQVRGLITAGLMHPELIADSLAQAAPALRTSLVPDLLTAVTRAPRAALGMAPTLARAARLQAMHHRYPSTPERVPAWHAARHRLLIAAQAA